VITVTASNRLWGHHLRQQLRRAAVDRQLGLQLRDPPAGGDELGVVATGDARQLPGIDQMLPPPQVDHLIADLQIGGDLRDRTPAATGSRTLRRDYGGQRRGKTWPPRVAGRKIIQKTRLRRAGGTSERPDMPGRFM
jgi:hypothetical protein